MNYACSEKLTGFGFALIKNEGEKFGYIDASATQDETISKTRWIEVCYSESEFKDSGIGEETIEVICADIEQRFNHLNEDQKYAAITALINRLIPESGY